MAVWARDDHGGILRVSSGGFPPLRVGRSGWVRIAVPTGGHPVAALGVECAPVPAVKAAGAGSCGVDVARAFTLDTDYVPGPGLLAPQRIQLGPGQLRLVDLEPRR